MMAPYILCIIGGYLMGSIPFGLIATRLGGAGDLRQIGSGNIGATNVLRTGRRDLAAITLIGDGAKGALAVLLAAWLIAPIAGVLAGGAAFLGHLYPVWLKFRGGKGVATFFGVMFAMAWPAAILCALAWLTGAFATRISSLGALAAAALAPLFLFLTHQAQAGRIWLAAAMAVLIFIRHRENIARLSQGTEPRFGGAKSKPGP